MTEVYGRRTATLDDTVKDDAGRTEAVAALRSLVSVAALEPETARYPCFIRCLHRECAL